MSYSATVLNVLIASPSDVPDEREAIAQALHDWNGLHSTTTGLVLLPVRWESHSAPAMGERPQGIINDQVVKSCDMLIGAFWTRLGSSTGVEESGTVEEIKWFLKQRRPVMLYYSSADIPQNKLDIQQLERLNRFKDSIRDQGVQEKYSSCQDLQQKLSRHLTIITRGMSVNPSVAKSAVLEANAEARSSEQSSQIELIDYTDKAFIVKGNTSKFKSELHEARGKWMRTKQGYYGWMFSKRRLNEIAAILSVEAKLSS